LFQLGLPAGYCHQVLKDQSALTATNEVSFAYTFVYHASVGAQLHQYQPQATRDPSSFIATNAKSFENTFTYHASVGAQINQFHHETKLPSSLRATNQSSFPYIFTKPVPVGSPLDPVLESHQANIVPSSLRPAKAPSLEATSTNQVHIIDSESEPPYDGCPQRYKSPLSLIAANAN
jgi:hypothetical protein